MKKLINTIITIMVTLSILGIAWFTMSFIEINIKSYEPNPQYSKYNIIVTATNWVTEYHENN